jgi:hypothetical protein
MIHELVEIGRRSGMEINVKKGNENLKATIPNADYGGSQQTGECEMFCLCSLTTSDARCRLHVKSNPGLSWQQQHSTRRFLSPANYT